MLNGRFTFIEIRKCFEFNGHTVFVRDKFVRSGAIYIHLILFICMSRSQILFVIALIMDEERLRHNGQECCVGGIQINIDFTII